MRHLEQQAVIEKFNLVHKNKYNYDKFVFQNTNVKGVITCEKHGDFEQTARDHFRGRGCPSCKGDKIRQAMSLTPEQFIEKAKKTHGDRYIYDKVSYQNACSKIIIGCKEHGVFTQWPSNHLKGNGCPKCGVEESRKKRALTTEEFIRRAKLTHGDKYDYSRVIYTHGEAKVELICREHGSFFQAPADHLQRKGCVLCRNERLREKFSLTTEQFIEKARAIHGDRYDYSKVVYVNDRTKVRITCREHGEFLQAPRGHLNFKGCSKCSSSIGERCLELIFIKNKINYITQYKLPLYNFEYDFYLPDYNLFIEFHGVQHYRSISYFGGDSGFAETRRRDLLKVELAKMHKISFLEISYKNLHRKTGISEELILKTLNRISLRKIKTWVYHKL